MCVIMVACFFRFFRVSVFPIMRSLNIDVVPKFQLCMTFFVSIHVGLNGGFK